MVKAILPISILLSSQNEFSREAIINMGITALITISYYIVAIVFAMAIGRIVKLSTGKRAVFVIMVVFANVGFIGFPLAAELYGAEGTLYAVIYNICYQLLFFTYGISLLSGQNKVRLDMLYKNPVTIFSLCTVILFLFQIKLPDNITSALSSVGNMTVPVSMILIGCSLADAHVKEIIKDGYSYIVSFLRMLFLPCIMILVLKVLNLTPEITGTIALLTALPAGSLNVVYAEQYQCEPEFASRTVVQTMILMVLTIPAFIILINIML